MAKLLLFIGPFWPSTGTIATRASGSSTAPFQPSLALALQQRPERRKRWQALQLPDPLDHAARTVFPERWRHQVERLGRDLVPRHRIGAGAAHGLRVVTQLAAVG